MAPSDYCGYQYSTIIEIINSIIIHRLPAVARKGWNSTCGTLGNGEAAAALASMIEAGCDENLRGHLIHFAVRVGARRLADAATCLARVGCTDAAQILSEQAALVGSLQYPLSTGRDAEAATVLRRLAVTYQQLSAALPS